MLGILLMILAGVVMVGLKGSSVLYHLHDSPTKERKGNNMRMPSEFEQSKHTYVFGSNLAGIHGKGTAKTAVDHYGAEYGKGYGFAGQSYAIPTKNHNLQVLPLNIIENHVKVFLTFAREHMDMLFYITPIGTGLAGYKHEDIAPMFKDAPANCWMIQEWLTINNS